MLRLPERLPLPLLRTLSESLSEEGKFSLAGEELPLPLRCPRRPIPARTRLLIAWRRWRAAKFLLPSCLEVGLALSSSIEGGPRG